MASKGKKTSSKAKKTRSKASKTRSTKKKRDGGEKSSTKAAQAPPVVEAVAPIESPGPDDAVEVFDLNADYDHEDLEVFSLDADIEGEDLKIGSLAIESDREERVDLDVDRKGEDTAVVDLDADLDMGEAGERLAGATDSDEFRDRLLAETMALVEGEEAAARPAVTDADAQEADDSKTRDGLDTSLIEEEDEDEAPAFDLGPSSTPEERAFLLAAALAHAEMQEARYRVPLEVRKTAQWKSALALAIFGLAALFAIAPPGIVVPAPPAQIRSGDMLYGIRVALLLQAEQIEAFRAREQRLPDSLDDLAARLPGVRYVRSSNRLYQLIAYTARGDAVVFDSAATSPEFETIVRHWAADRGS